MLSIQRKTARFPFTCLSESCVYLKSIADSQVPSLLYTPFILNKWKRVHKWLFKVTNPRSHNFKK